MGESGALSLPSEIEGLLFAAAVAVGGKVKRVGVGRSGPLGVFVGTIAIVVALAIGWAVAVDCGVAVLVPGFSPDVAVATLVACGVAVPDTVVGTGVLVAPAGMVLIGAPPNVVALMEEEKSDSVLPLVPVLTNSNTERHR